MQFGLHSHFYNGRTTLNDGHVHRYSGVTSSDPDVPGHIHYMVGETTFDDGHIHRYTLQTSPGIAVDGGHTHYYQASTSFEDGHIHYMYGYTEVHR